MFRLDVLLGAAVVAVLGVAACGGDSGGGPADASPDAVVRPDAATVDPTGAHYNFVADSIIMPTSSSEATALGLDIDGDGDVDNRLGAVVAALSGGGGGDVNVELQSQIDTGELILLANLQATSLGDAANTGLWVWKGDSPMPAPCADATDTVCRRHLDGTGTFTVAAADPEASLIVGAVAGGHVSGGPGFAKLEVPLGFASTPLTLELIGARVEADVSETGFANGRLAGAVTEDYIQSSVLPQLVAIMGDILAEDCTGTSPSCCEDGSSGEQIINLFDADGDCDVSITELQQSSLLTSLLAPDVDLLDEEGFYLPNRDGVQDSTSLGVAFTAVPALYPLPPGI